MANISLISATHDIDSQSRPDGFSGVHTHEYSELIFIKSGTLSFTASDHTYTATSGDLVYVGKLESHSSQLIEGTYDRYYVQLSYDIAGRNTRLTKLLYFFQADPRRFGHVLHTGEYCDEVMRIFDLLLEEYNRPQNFSEEYIRGLLLQLLSVISRIAPERFLDKHSGWDQLMSSIQKYLDEHFTEPISVERLAKDNFISSDYLARRFKQSTGFSPKQYICLNRLVYAKKLLMTGHLPVSEVARRSGFSDVNNFIRSFKNQFGHSPGRYRSMEMRASSDRRKRRKNSSD